MRHFRSPDDKARGPRTRPCKRARCRQLSFHVPRLQKNISSHCLRCAQCERFFHAECVSVPSEFEHDHHDHALTLMDGLPYTSHPYLQSEYSCDICEGMIKGARSIQVYGCDECKLYAHIECVLSKKDGFVQFSSSLLRKNHSSDKEIIKKAIHDHPLSLQNGTNKLCRMCMLQMEGQAYACEECHDDDEFWVHEKCASLPQTLHGHPLHPNHELDLAKRILLRRVFNQQSRCRISADRDWFICAVCGDVSQGFHFSCRSCEFFVDVKCVLDADKFRQTFYDKYARKTLNHPLHPQHELTLANFNAGIHAQCRVCFEKLLGPSYCCTKCISYSYHETCMEWPRLVEGHPTAPRHVLQLDGTITWQVCFACENYTHHGYKVINARRQIYYHLECGSSLARPFDRRRGGHSHRFYYLHNKPKGILRKVFKCASCREEVRNSYYRCLKCGLYFHFGCLRDAAWLPSAAKHKHHQHRLTLKEYVEYGGYYCDVCEEPRDPRHPSYGCDVCEIVVHVECIISEENASSVVLEEIENDGVMIPKCSKPGLYIATRRSERSSALIARMRRL
ncbi:PREDICTED: uncharacterized protein LOC104806508 [Tarenaya hassleriana]|uniref:uncharacterized protein LOC104806508 n=1 Tax=Tarenaya hassleriana TaxID=28532 RepID=UPI00053C3E11|nr:PREDICTED: uncharacterized protein LOC104806508 [Tarenaya hassleriana]